MGRFQTRKQGFAVDFLAQKHRITGRLRVACGHVHEVEVVVEAGEHAPPLAALRVIITEDTWEEYRHIAETDVVGYRAHRQDTARL